MGSKDFDKRSDVETVLLAQNKNLSLLKKQSDANSAQVEDVIQLAEKAIKSLGGIRESNIAQPIAIKRTNSSFVKVRSWDEIRAEAQEQVVDDERIVDLFTIDELRANETYINKLNEDFNSLHKLDSIDYIICGVSGVLAAAIDIFLVGMPAVPLANIKGGPLSNYIREKFTEAFPKEKIHMLEKKNWVPYDAANNSNLHVYVKGLSAYFHRYHSLGHDPVLGFIFGVIDVMSGTFTAIDQDGKFIRQAVENQSTMGMNLFEAIQRVFGHMKSDAPTAMGLPAPLMTLLNLFQFGSIGENKETIAELGRSMYYQGYDFIHFLSMSIPTLVIEVLVRTAYFAKRKKEGFSLTESIPLDIPHKKPKLGTMLFLSHAIATAANAGKVAFLNNPLAVNYTEWMAFAKYAFQQLKWALLSKPSLRAKYVQGYLDSEWCDIDKILESTWIEFTKDSIVVYES